LSTKYDQGHFIRRVANKKQKKTKGGRGEMVESEKKKERREKRREEYTISELPQCLNYIRRMCSQTVVHKLIGNVLLKVSDSVCKGSCKIEIDIPDVHSERKRVLASQLSRFQSIDLNFAQEKGGELRKEREGGECLKGDAFLVLRTYHHNKYKHILELCSSPIA